MNKIIEEFISLLNNLMHSFNILEQCFKFILIHFYKFFYFNEDNLKEFNEILFY